MRFISAIAAFFMMIVAGCSMPLAQKEQGALLLHPEEACLEQLVPAIREVTGLQHVRISKNPFAGSDTVVLTNHPRHPYPADDPLVGVAGSEKIVRLLKAGERCFVALIDETGKIVRKVPLTRCRCQAKEAQ